MVFNYEFEDRAFYIPSSDEWDSTTKEFEYEVSDDDLLVALSTLFEASLRKQSSWNAMKSIMNFIAKHDLLEELVDEYENELHEYFKNDAKKAFEEDE